MIGLWRPCPRHGLNQVRACSGHQSLGGPCQPCRVREIRRGRKMPLPTFFLGRQLTARSTTTSDEATIVGHTEAASSEREHSSKRRLRLGKEISTRPTTRPRLGCRRSLAAVQDGVGSASNEDGLLQLTPPSTPTGDAFFRRQGYNSMSGNSRCLCSRPSPSPSPSASTSGYRRYHQFSKTSGNRSSGRCPRRRHHT